jgi:hypothetical protein
MDEDVQGSSMYLLQRTGNRAYIAMADVPELAGAAEAQFLKPHEYYRKVNDCSLAILRALSKPAKHDNVGHGKPTDLLELIRSDTKGIALDMPVCAAWGFPFKGGIDLGASAQHMVNDFRLDIDLIHDIRMVASKTGNCLVTARVYCTDQQGLCVSAYYTVPLSDGENCAYLIVPGSKPAKVTNVFFGVINARIRLFRDKVIKEKAPQHRFFNVKSLTKDVEDAVRTSLAAVNIRQSTNFKKSNSYF